MLVFFIIILFLVFIIALSKLEIQIEVKKGNYRIILLLSVLKNFRYLKVVVNKSQILDLLKNQKTKRNLYKIEKNYFKSNGFIKKVIKKLNLNLEYLNFDLKIGTEFILLTTMIITTLSTIFPMFVRKIIKKYDEKNLNYKFTPIYNKNQINLALNCIISVRLVHIISTILYILFKKGEIKNVGTSNTRFNDNCYE